MKNYILRHLKDSDYSIKIKGEKDNHKFTFSHYFANTALANHSIAIYKNDNYVVLINEYFNRATNQNCILLTQEKWSRVVDETDGMNNVSSLAYLLDKYFDTNFFED